MTITQYSFNNSVTPEFKWTFFENRNNLDELINIPTKAEERSMIQISFRIQVPNIPESASKITADPWSTVFSKSANPLDLPQKFTVCTLFKAKSVDQKTHSPPS